MTDKIKCVICRKTIKREDPEMVHMSTLGVIWTEGNDPALSMDDDQGWFEVGSDCFRKVAKTGKDGYRL